MAPSAPLRSPYNDGSAYGSQDGSEGDERCVFDFCRRLFGRRDVFCSRFNRDLADHAHGFMGFANKGVGTVHAPFKREGLIHGTCRFTGIEHLVFFNSVVRKGLTAPEEPNGIALCDGDGRG